MYLIRRGNSQFYGDEEQAIVFANAGYEVFAMTPVPISAKELTDSAQPMESPSIEEVSQHEDGGVIYTQEESTWGAQIKNPVIAGESTGPVSSGSIGRRE